VKYLEKNDYFGLKKEWVSIVKQENVPAIINNQAEFGISDSEFAVLTKPHGHGDIHALLY
jgi:UDP-sugar pyrophosphorylase